MYPVVRVTLEALLLHDHVRMLHNVVRQLFRPGTEYIEMEALDDKTSTETLACTRRVQALRERGAFPTAWL